MYSDTTSVEPCNQHFFEHHHNDSMVKGFACQNYTFYVQFNRTIEGGFFVFITADFFPFYLFQIPNNVKIL